MPYSFLVKRIQSFFLLDFMPRSIMDLIYPQTHRILENHPNEEDCYKFFEIDIFNKFESLTGKVGIGDEVIIMKRYDHR